MTFKEWTAVIQLAGLALIAAWLAFDIAGNPAAYATINAAAGRLVWAIVAVIAFNIVATIVVTILVSIARREELKDEKADERDRFVNARSSRNGYVVTSTGAALSLLALAFGADPVLGAFALFGAPMLGGTVDAISQLIYYRLG